MPYKNKEDQAKASRRHYEKNKEKVVTRNQKRRRERKEWFYETFVKSSSCEKCEESDRACLDFHHKDPSTKEDKISKMVNEFRSKKMIIKEVAKCIILCSNCHRKLHYYEKE